MPRRIETKDASTQTGLAGVPEPYELYKSDALCAICSTDSDCHWCLSPENECADDESRIIRTQDILLTNKQCHPLTPPQPAIRKPASTQANEVKPPVPTCQNVGTYDRSSKLQEACPCASRDQKKPKVTGK